MNFRRSLIALTMIAVASSGGAVSAQQGDAPKVLKGRVNAGQFCNSGEELKFLLDREVPVSEELRAWFEPRRLTSEYVTGEPYVTLIIAPPSSSATKQTEELVGEIAHWRPLIPECPEGAQSMPAHVAVEGLHIVEGKGAPIFQVSP